MTWNITSLHIPANVVIIGVCTGLYATFHWYQLAHFFKQLIKISQDKSFYF